MDKPTCGMAIVGAAAASLIFGGASGQKASGVDASSAIPVATASSVAATPSVSAASVACGRDPAARGRTTSRQVAPSVVPPVGPSDAQVNANGTGAAGGAGTVPGEARGDPCEPDRRFRSGTARVSPAASAAASAAATLTPTTINRR